MVQNEAKKNGRLLLVELRMNYLRADNLKCQSMEKKVTHTRQLLGRDIQIDKNSYFVFDDKHISIFRSFLSRRKRAGNYKDWQFVSVSDIKKEFGI